MVPYEAFDQDVEIKGRTVLQVVETAMGRFSEEYRDRANAALTEEGIVDPAPDEWYPQQAWLNAFETIADDLEPHVLDRLGEQLPSIHTRITASTPEGRGVNTGPVSSSGVVPPHPR